MVVCHFLFESILEHHGKTNNEGLVRADDHTTKTNLEPKQIGTLMSYSLIIYENV
jgi:hypothetical protein